MHSIRFKITAIASGAIVVAFLCVFLVSLSTFQAENDRRSVEMMNLIGLDTRMSLEKYTESIEQSVDLIANLASDTMDSVMLVRGGVVGTDAERAKRTPEREAELDEYLAEYCEKIQEVSATVAGHTQGIVTYYYCINPEISTTEHGFFYSRVGKTGFEEREPLDARELDPNDLEHTTWYYTPIERGYPSWVGPYTAHFLNEMWISSYLVPIYKSGALIGVLGMDISADVLISQVSSLKVYDTGFACLIDDQGRIVYHPEFEFGTVPDFPADAKILQQEESGDALIRYTRNGEERQMSFTTLSNGMKLAVIAPVNEINASTLQLIRVITPIAVAIVIIFALIIMLVMRAITRPLLSLTSASQQLAEGDYDVELNYKGKDEVGTLTSAFQKMRDQMKAYIDDLNRRVRTDDLTGLPNQRYFFSLAEAERTALLDAGKRPIMLYFNLVGMKHFNRQYGFGEGDQLIREVAGILSRHFGELSTSRFGQDHFAAVTDDERLEERLAEVFEECRSANGGRTLPVSVGIYPDSLEVVGASAACDRAKYACDRRRGSYISGYCYFDKCMVKQIETVRYIINHLDRALEERWIQVYYQPIVRAVNSKVCDEEALSRWVDPDRGFMSPDEFITALEDSGLIYKLDLYVLDRVLEKMKVLEDAGLPVVPHSINLSRSDFDACDIVEEIRKRVDAAGFNRDRITIEITESVIGRDFDFMKTQVERFQELGFPVWMDDFGSGYSSLDVLQSISFNLLKFDMSFLRKLDEGENGKIILTELMKMATALGVDTICEGVETEEQKCFLQEIGCSKLQGYYFCRPIPLSELLQRYEKDEQIGYENPEESGYFEAISRVNLFDLAAIASEEDGTFQNIFDAIPMGVMEIKDDKAKFIRTNRAYRDFMMRFFGFDLAERTSNYDAAPDVGAGSSFMRLVRECCEKDTRTLYDEKMPDGSIVHSVARRISANSVTGATAVAIAVLSITESGEDATYASIARALAVDYYSIYYVDLDTEQFIEYSSRVGEEEIALERHGEGFFTECKHDIMERIHEDDREALAAIFTKENVVHELEGRGVFTTSCRLASASAPTTANIKVTRMDPEGRHIIVGINVIDN